VTLSFTLIAIWMIIHRPRPPSSLGWSYLQARPVRAFSSILVNLREFLFAARAHLLAEETRWFMSRRDDGGPRRCSQPPQPDEPALDRDGSPCLGQGLAGLASVDATPNAQSLSQPMIGAAAVRFAGELSRGHTPAEYANFCAGTPCKYSGRVFPCCGKRMGGGPWIRSSSLFCVREPTGKW
jgi:hypothetical protein